MQQEYPSKLLDKAVAEFSKLPGIGKKTALRLVLHLLKKKKEEVTIFGSTIIEMREKIMHCQHCNNISDEPVCDICLDIQRTDSQICVVENIKDVLAIEKTQQYNGKYFVLGGLISPMDGIGPSDIEVEGLLQRIDTTKTNEVILALSATPEGDTTAFYIFRKIGNRPAEITMLARGVAIGDELEYADEITLGRSLINRIKFS